MSSEFLAGVGYPQPFADLVVELCASAAREVCILSPRLDHAAFATLGAIALQPLGK